MQARRTLLAPWSKVVRPQRPRILCGCFRQGSASLSSCYTGRGGNNKTEGLQYLEPKGNVLLCSPGELPTLRRQYEQTSWQEARTDGMLLD